MPARFVASLSCFLAVAVIGGRGAHTSQREPQRPVFRSGAIFVSVDAYPRKDEKVVEGLTKADFEIFEDGKPQSVEAFEFIRVSSVTPDDERRDPTSVQDGYRQAADPHNRVFVVYLDLFNTTFFGASYARQPIIEFLTRAIGPTDLFAVMTPELPVTGLTFARRTETLDDELRRYWDWSEGPDRKTVSPRNQHEGRLIVCGIDGEALVRAYRKDLTVQSVEQLIQRLGGLRDERKNILFISEGWALPSGRPGGRSRSAYPSIPSIGVGPGGKMGMGANMSGTDDRAWCDAQYAHLMNIDYPARFRGMVDMAVRANVAFYPINVGGLSTSGGFTMPDGSLSRGETLWDMALSTGGDIVANTNDLVSGVRRIADDLSAFYLLGYYSNNSAADGKFRRIEVKVRQPGVKVSARRGYLAPTEAMRRAEIEAASKPIREDTAVDRELSRLSRLRTDAKLFTAAVASPTGLDVIVEIASQEFGSGRWSNGGAVRVEVLPKNEGATPVTTEAKLEAGSRGLLIKVPVTTKGADSWRIRTRVEGSGELLDDEIEVAAAGRPTIGEPLVFRANAGPRAPLRPVADFKFFRTERMHVEWTLAKPLDDRTARLLNRRGEPLAVPVALTERADGDLLVLAADLTLAPLADGDYVIEVTASAGGEKVQKLLAFRVVR